MRKTLTTLALVGILGLSGCGGAPKPIVHTRNGVTRIERHYDVPCYFDTDDKISRTEFCGRETLEYARVVSLPNTEAERAIRIELRNSEEFGRNQPLYVDEHGRQLVVRGYYPIGQELESRFKDITSRYEAPVRAKQN